MSRLLSKNFFYKCQYQIFAKCSKNQLATFFHVATFVLHGLALRTGECQPDRGGERTKQLDKKIKFYNTKNIDESNHI